jgi:hypothetical protein
LRENSLPEILWNDEKSSTLLLVEVISKHIFYPVLRFYTSAEEALFSD